MIILWIVLAIIVTIIAVILIRRYREDKDMNRYLGFSMEISDFLYGLEDFGEMSFSKREFRQMIQNPAFRKELNREFPKSTFVFMEMPSESAIIIADVSSKYCALLMGGDQPVKGEYLYFCADYERIFEIWQSDDYTAKMKRYARMLWVTRGLVMSPVYMVPAV